ncbi:MAG TPA: GNAT family N-acetyltransferase [Acidimicrobiia bacterium]
MHKRELSSLDSRGSELLDFQARPRDPLEHRIDALTALRMARSGVVPQGRWVARNYNVHVLTLAQVASLLRVEGSWPGSISLNAGWYRARARPWNESITDPMVRLDRGGSDFLRLVTTHLHGLGVDTVYSPALYPGSTDVWRRAGFDGFVSLDVMERPLIDTPFPVGETRVVIARRPDWEQILAVDRLAFDGFWGMSRLGLREAHTTNRTSAVLAASEDKELTGYAIVGTQWATVYLHRIAVRPNAAGRGLGAALVAAALDWGARSGAKSMVLNVRPENRRATRLYERMGFARTETALQVLRHRVG